VHDDAELVEAAQAAGGIGYVIKARLGSDLLRAVREARVRHPFVSIRR
jgi:DNA-binding NarL/FixJ family response regulator